MSCNTLLIELLTEELPPKSLRRLSECFADGVRAGLERRKLLAEGAAHRPFATPRRLAVQLDGVLRQAPDYRYEEKLMPVSVAFDAAGQPTPALLKKLAAKGLSTDLIGQLERRPDGRNETLFHVGTARGETLAACLDEIVEAALKALPITKLMRWGDSEHQFVRPVHGLVMLLDGEVVDGRVLGLASGRQTRGHRFLAHGAINLARAADYETALETEGAVIPSFQKRRDRIQAALNLHALEARATINPADGLLDEVTALVEWPVVYVGEFEREFLEVPQECLILTMQQNQKYFPLLDADGRLMNRFLIVSNMQVTDPRHIVGGNQRVVRPRLADARFFFSQDRRKSLESRVPGLARVVYHNRLGSQGERVERIAAIARAVAELLGGGVLARQAEQAAILAKADLLTDMVGEFPELQGVMGRYYAQYDGLPAEICDAIEDHYRPRFSGDALPRGRVGAVVALADKLETLVGMFGIGQLPSGDKDPFALRRHALGVIRILVEGELPLQVDELVDVAHAAFPRELIGDARGALRDFIVDRLRGYLRDRGGDPLAVEAVIGAAELTAWSELPRRLAAVRAFAELPEAAALAAANKRVGNLLKKADGRIAAQVDAAVLREGAEIALAEALAEVTPQAGEAFARGDYTAALCALAALRTPVDRFFDEVMVNVDDVRLRENRLGLLAMLHQAMNRVADLSRLSA
jgi:glycyl-tRNA synthetase beta chain